MKWVDKILLRWPTFWYRLHTTIPRDIRYFNNLFDSINQNYFKIWNLEFALGITSDDRKFPVQIYDFVEPLYSGTSQYLVF